MLARSTTIIHPSGKEIRTPILIPSFSSKGFGNRTSGQAEVSQLFKLAKEQLTEAALLSAYDIFHKLIRAPRNALTEIMFLDSGGYETSDYQDLSAVFSSSADQKKWTQANLRSVYDAWPSHIPAVFVSFDRRLPIKGQIAKAKRFFRRYPKQLHAFLVKPQSVNARSIAIAELIAAIPLLKDFHILGVTEKELGRSMLERMHNISRLRVALDEGQLQRIPIHVFGSLDPLTVPLYFLAGAEIFDGLTWLRFGYHRGSALYIQNGAVRRFGIQHSDDQVKLLNLQQNLISLSDLTMQMKRFLNAFDFNTLAPNSTELIDAFELLKNANPAAA